MRKLVLFLDRNGGEMFFSGMSSMSYGRDSASKRQRAFEREAGTKSTRDVFYSSAQRFFLPVFLAEAQAGSPRQSVLNLLRQIPERGFGAPELLEMGESKARVRVSNCYNALAYEVSASPVCHEMCGMLSALFQAACGRSSDCKETACVSTGKSFCEFEVSLGKPFKNAGRSAKADLKSKETSEILCDDQRGEVFSMGVSSIIYPRGMPAAIEDGFESLIGQQKVKEICYRISKSNVERNIRRGILRHFFLKNFNVFLRSSIITEFEKLGAVLGWGKLDVTKVGKGVVEVRIDNSYNAMKGRRRACGCFSLTGSIAAATAIILNADVHCTETMCMAKGDGFCAMQAKLISEMAASPPLYPGKGG